jgi:uncharacterized protein YggT (Ycf19 family)
MGGFAAILLQSLVVTAWLVILGRVLMSWIDLRFEKPLGQFLYSLTEPFLAPIRRVLRRRACSTSRPSSCSSGWAC